MDDTFSLEGSPQNRPEAKRPGELTPSEVTRLKLLLSVIEGERFQTPEALQPLGEYLKARNVFDTLNRQVDRTLSEKVRLFASSLKIAGLEDPGAQEKLFRTLIGVGLVASLAFLTLHLGQRTGELVTQIPNLTAEVVKALVYFDPRLINLGEFMPKLEGFRLLPPNPPAAFNPMFTAHEKAVDIASQALYQHVGETIKSGLLTVGSGVLTGVTIARNPVRYINKLIVNSGRTLETIADAIKNVERHQ